MNPRRILATALLAFGLSGFPAAAQQAGLTVDSWSGLSSGRSLLILREEGISDRAPDSVAIVGEAKLTGIASGTGVRLRGTITPMVDDEYTFWVNGASNVALWLSGDGSRFDKELIASNLDPTTQTEWAKHKDQRSEPVFLEAGKSYHIEAHVMSGVANGHLAIAWQGRRGNWALADNGATASQSSTQWSSVASRAIDGAFNTSSQTANQQNSWLKVDFAETRPVNQIVLHNPSTNQNRLSNFRISLLDENGATVTSEDFFTESGHVGNSFAWDLPSVHQISSVKIQLLGLNLAGNGHLTLAEVQAFHNTPPPVNHALAANGATASQSTTSGSATAALAIDGDDQTASLTEDHADSWIEVDFGQDRAVNRIILHNDPQHPSRLSNFRISLLDGNDDTLVSEDFFTASGHAGAIHYWNLIATHQAHKVRVELLGQNLDENGHLSLTGIEALEIDPVLEAREFQIIPGAYLKTIAPHPNDLNDNYLPDDFEQSTGLAASSDPAASLQHGDPDGDGISNYDEFRFGGDPLTAETWGDGLTRSIWTDLTGSGVSSMTSNRARFHSYPNQTAHVPNIDDTPGRIHYGVRYRGKFVAPTTGTYRFWISSSTSSQLWIADGTVKHPSTGEPLTDRFGKQHLATSGHFGTGIHHFDFHAAQRTRAVQLAAGQAYYIEVLHKHANTSGAHIAVAWQPPGQSRAIMPSEAFLALAPHPNDQDDDNLPDDWEIAVGLDPTDNGLISAAQGEYGDPDGDGLTNLQEFQYGTNPFSADTDGDGLSDFEEIFFYGTDPTVSNNLDPVAIVLPPIQQYTRATGAWSTDANGSLVSWERRGGITYTFTVTEPGIHEVTVAAGAISPQPWFTKHLNLVLSLGDEAPFATGTITSQYGHSGTLKRLTPWLGAGTHSITIHHENFLAELRLRLDSVTIERLGGQDLDEDGVPDWVLANETPHNKLTRVPTESRTSPVSIEGITGRLSTATVEGASGSFSLTASINNTFFTDIPLDEEGPVTINASFLNGIIQESREITWIATNLFEFDQGALHIRQGDALRLTAHELEGASGSFIIQASAGVPPAPTEATESTEPLTLTFDTPGTHTLTATWSPENGPEESATVTLHVHAADFGAIFPVRINQTRTWTLPHLGTDVHVDSDDKVIMGEITAPAGTRTFNVNTNHASHQHVIARIPETVEGAPAAILARGTVQGFHAGWVEQTRDASIVHRYDDGTWLMHHTIVGVNIPPGVVLRITITSPGTTFTNGSTVLELRAEDFDQNGIAHIYYEYTGDGDPRLCHKAHILIEN
ncbi:MAG: discoidin domain-containing protein [Luteolibacter sp.]